MAPFPGYGLPNALEKLNDDERRWLIVFVRTASVQLEISRNKFKD